MNFQKINFARFLNLFARKVIVFAILLLPILLINACFNLSVTKRKHNPGYHINLSNRVNKTAVQIVEQNAIVVNQSDLPIGQMDEVLESEDHFEVNSAPSSDESAPATGVKLPSAILKGAKVLERVNHFSKPLAPISGFMLDSFLKSKVVEQLILEAKSVKVSQSYSGWEIVRQVFFWMFLIVGFVMLIGGLLMESGVDDNTGCLISGIGLGLMLLAVILMMNQI